MPKIPLSVVILSQEYTPQLQSAIQSVWFADEIIIIDTSGSKSITLAKQTSIQLQRVPKITNFSTTRNQAFTFVNNDWVFFLDSDEQVVCPNEDLFVTLMQKNVSAFAIKREDHFLGKVLQYGETAHSFPTRLLRKNHCLYAGVVHETVVCDGIVETINPQHIKLAHFPHPSINSFFTKICWYSNLEAQLRTSSISTLLLQMMLFPPIKWLTNLILKQGLLDGYRGIVYATLMSFHSLFVRLFQIEKFVLKNRHD